MKETSQPTRPANTESLTSSEYEVTNELEKDEISNNNALQGELKTVTKEKNTREDDVKQSKQSVDSLSNITSCEPINNTININQSSKTTLNSEIQNIDAYSEENLRNNDFCSENNMNPISVTKDAIEVNSITENKIISLNTATTSDREDIELDNNENVQNNSLNRNPNEINEDNANTNNKENDVLIESELKYINNKKSVSNNLESSNELGTEKQALNDFINEIESNQSLTNEKSIEYSKMTETASNKNNNKENDDRNSVKEGYKGQRIKCEVDCDAMLDDVNDEIIIDEDYDVPENFMDLANHFLTNEARVVLQRIVVYKCPQCPRVFTSKGQLSMHKTKHISEQVISSLRNKENTDERFIKRHECPECDQRFVEESTLKAHMVIHRPYPNICHCGIGYTKLTDLQQHQKIVHNEIKSKPTHTSTWRPIINLKKTKRSEINRKRLKKQPEIREPTPEPTTSRYGRKQKRFLNLRESSPNLEYSSDDLDDESVFQPKKRKAKFKLKTPEQIQAEEQRLIKRENKELQKAQNKKRSVAIKQENKGPFKCSLCDTLLKTYGGYEVHLQLHSNLRNYICEVCDKRFNSSTGLRNHQKTHLESQFQCSFCDKKFNNKHNRKTHENIHMSVKPYVCGYCEKSFTDPSALKRHERIHTGVKPYKCEYCPKAFSDVSAAIVHRRRHKGERKFACRLCDKTYIAKGARDIHEKLHTSEYKFECDLCPAKFQLKQYLAVHLTRMHGARRKVKCSMCDAKVFKDNMARHKSLVHAIKGRKKKELSVFAVEIEIDLKKELSSDS